MDVLMSQYSAGASHAERLADKDHEQQQLELFGDVAPSGLSLKFAMPPVANVRIGGVV